MVLPACYPRSVGLQQGIARRKVKVHALPGAGAVVTNDLCINLKTYLAVIAEVILRIDTKRILGKCLLISSLPGKALRTLVDIARLAEQYNMRSQSRAW